MKDEIKETNDMWVKINNNDIKEVLDYYKKDIEDYEKKALDGYGISNKEAYQRYKNHKLILYHIANLQEDVEDLRRIFGVWNNRKLIKKFNKEYDKEDKTKNPNRDYVAIYPDAEEVYKRYYALKEENKRLKLNINNAKEFIEQHRVREMSIVEVNALEGILNE